MELSQDVKRLKNYQTTQILPENPEGGESSPDYFFADTCICETSM